MKAITGNAFYEIPLEKEQEYEQSEVEASIAQGQCYCHVSMHTHHPEPCHFCQNEVREEFIAWCKADEEAEQARENPAPEIEVEISPLDLEIAASIIAYEIELGKLDTEWFSRKERK